MKKFIFILIFCIISTNIIEADNLTDGLVLYMSFNNTIDDYSVLNLATSYYITGSYTTVDKPLGHGYDFILKQNSEDLYYTTGGFDGSDINITYNTDGAVFNSTSYINFSTNLHKTNNGTIIIRFKVNESDFSTRRKIFITSSYYIPSITLEIHEITYKLRIYANNGSANSYISIIPISEIYNEWHTVAVNWNNTNIDVYYDNIYNDTISLNGGNYSDGVGFYAGYYPDLRNGWFNGSISSLLVFNETISNDERTNYYNQGNYTSDNKNIENESLSFDGKPFTTVMIENNTNLDFINENFTFSLWVKLAGIGLASGSRIISKANYQAADDKGGYELFYLKSDASLRFRIQNDSSSIDVTSGVNSINLNTWYHIAGRRTDTNISLFVNGIYNDSNIFSGLLKSSFYPLQIGNNHITYLEGRNSPTNGTIDNVRVYNRSLSDSEISSIYTSEKITEYVSQIKNLSVSSNTSNSIYIVFNYTNSSTTSANIYIDGLLNNTNTYPDNDYNITNLTYGFYNITVKAVYDGNENISTSTENNILFKLYSHPPNIILNNPNGESIANPVNFSFTPICYTNNCTVEIYLNSTDYNYTSDFVRMNNGDRIITLGEGNAWDNTTINGGGVYYNDSHYYVYYGGGDNLSRPKEGYDIGLAIGKTLDNLTKYEGNPIYNASSINSAGLIPTYFLEINGTYYLYVTRVNWGNGNWYQNLSIMNSTDLINWNDPVDIFTKYDYYVGANVRTDPYNSSQLILYVAYYWYNFTNPAVEMGRATGGTIYNPGNFIFDDENSPLMTEKESNNLTTNHPVVRFRNYKYHLTYMYRNASYFWMKNSTNNTQDTKFLNGDNLFYPSMSGWDNSLVAKSTFINNDTSGIENMLYIGRNVSIGARYYGIGLAQRNYTVINTWESRKIILNITNNTINSILFNVSNESTIWNAKIIQDDGQIAFASSNYTIFANATPTIPTQITNLTNLSQTTDSVYINYTNSTEHNNNTIYLLMLDDINTANITQPYNITGLTYNTEYNITIYSNNASGTNGTTLIGNSILATTSIPIGVPTVYLNYNMTNMSTSGYGESTYPLRICLTFSDGILCLNSTGFI